MCYLIMVQEPLWVSPIMMSVTVLLLWKITLQWSKLLMVMSKIIFLTAFWRIVENTLDWKFQMLLRKLLQNLTSWGLARKQLSIASETGLWVGKGTGVYLSPWYTVILVERRVLPQRKDSFRSYCQILRTCLSWRKVALSVTLIALWIALALNVINQPSVRSTR